ncbi:MAG: nicotinate-nucleotide adenylyltransferase [Ktedonobacterales bacterium]
MQKRSHYGILGGTFDPPHIGHLAIAQEAYVRLGLDRVWFMPAGTPPHKAGSEISPASHRRAMVELAIADDPRFGLLTVELERAGPSYTAETLNLLRRQWGSSTAITLILGWDMLTYLPKWHDPEGVIAAVDQIAAVHRPGFEAQPSEVERLEAQLPGLTQHLVVLPAPQLDIAGTSLRERVEVGLPIRYLVPDAVCRYIEEHRLYQVHRSADDIRNAIVDNTSKVNEG